MKRPEAHKHASSCPAVQDIFRCSPASDQYPLHLVKRNLVAAPIVKLRGAGAGVIGHGCGLHNLDLATKTAKTLCAGSISVHTSNLFNKIHLPRLELHYAP